MRSLLSRRDSSGDATRVCECETTCVCACGCVKKEWLSGDRALNTLNLGILGGHGEVDVDPVAGLTINISSGGGAADRGIK